MFSSPTAIRVLKKQDPAYLTKYDLSHAEHLFLAGEPLDEPTQRWISEALGRAGDRPLLADRDRLAAAVRASGRRERRRSSWAARASRSTATTCSCCMRGTGQEVGADEKGVVAIVPPLPPGCMTTVWGDDERFVQTYFTSFKDQLVYSTFDWGIRDKDGYYFILGRTDDVINVAGHRLGTREIEEAVQAASEHRRSRGGRRGRCAQGAGAARVCGREGRGQDRDAEDARPCARK